MVHLYKVRKRVVFFVIILSVFAIPLNAFSQLQVAGGGLPDSIIAHLVGGGLTVSNVVLNCGADSPTAAYGTFNGVSSNLGLPNGVILTTGQAVMAIGPNNLDGQGYCDGQALADPQLTTIEPSATNDVCILEFDVIPHCSSMQLRFVFGSEEYPEYVNGGFNDAFGFFVTGPGSDCTPGFYNNTNVAVLPSGTPVSIDNINAGFWAGCPLSQTGCMNCAYYVNNCGCVAPPCLQYDGYTNPITVTLNVCPCATYHWKFAIADAGDCAWDSGVMIDYLTCAAPFTYTVSTTNASCSCDGTASVNISSGTPPYTYSWLPSGQTGATATGLCAGTNTVSVTDAEGCSIPVIQTFNIGSISNLITATAQTNVTCFGQNNGIANVNAAGGNAPYTYSWSTTPVQTSQTATGLTAGSYTVTVTDAVNCSSIQIVTITQPSVLTSTGSTLSDVSCFSGNNGSATVNPGGGTAPYVYLWSPSGGNAITANNLSAGTYTVTVTDSHGCTITSTAVITQPSVLTAAGSTLTDVSCFSGNNGSATVNPGGGTAPYAFLWSPSGGNAITANNLAAGNYTVTVTDSHGCTITSTAVITQPSVLTAAGSTLTDV
jgi:hypothetical protein